MERFGRYHRTLHAGLNMVTPFVDRLRPLIDLREQVVSFPPQPVITRDNLVVGIDTVIYFQVTDPKAATYEVADYINAVEQLTVTTLRNVVGGMDLETVLTSRDQINTELRQELDEATGKWGIRVGRVELKAIEPPSLHPGLDGEADARRPGQAGRHLVRRGQQAVRHPERRGRATGGGAQGPRRIRGRRAARRGGGQGAGRPGPRAGRGHHHRVPRHPRGQPGPAAAGLPVHADAAADRPGRREQGLDRAERDRQGAGGHRRPARRRQPPAPAGPRPAPGGQSTAARSGTGPQLDPAIGRHAGLEGWLSGSGGPVHDGAVGDGEGRSVPGAGHAGSAPFNDDPSLV